MKKFEALERVEAAAGAGGCGAAGAGATDGAGPTDQAGLTEEQLLEVFKQTSTFTAASLKAQNQGGGDGACGGGRDAESFSLNSPDAPQSSTKTSRRTASRTGAPACGCACTQRTLTASVGTMTALPTRTSWRTTRTARARRGTRRRVQWRRDCARLTLRVRVQPPRDKAAKQPVLTAFNRDNKLLLRRKKARPGGRRRPCAFPPCPLPEPSLRPSALCVHRPGCGPVRGLADEAAASAAAIVVGPHDAGVHATGGAPRARG